MRGGTCERGHVYILASTLCYLRMGSIEVISIVAAGLLHNSRVLI